MPAFCVCFLVGLVGCFGVALVYWFPILMIYILYDLSFAVHGFICGVGGQLRNVFLGL